MAKPPPVSSYSAAQSRVWRRAGALSGPLVGPVTTAQHFVPPTARELRAQAVQRLQVGLFGLAAMLLLVGLANIIIQHARQSDPGQPDAALSDSAALAAKSASAAPGDSDPLADIGVAPSPAPGAGHRLAGTSTH